MQPKILVMNGRLQSAALTKQAAISSPRVVWSFASFLSASVLSALLVTAACSSSDADAGSSAPNPNGKTEGAQCTDGSECASLTCAQGKCTPVTGANPTDKTKNGDETDVDCGGKSAPPCADGKACTTATDCTSAICTGNVCVAPSPTDGVKNGDETDKDCGGTKAPKCKADQGCAKDSDCDSGGCAYTKKCAAFPSCTNHFGGDTCGAGETGAPDAKHESCCATATLADGTKIGKYQITAGRMRAFVERFAGDLKSWAATNPAGWDQGWNDQLPGNMDDALQVLGPDGKRGCNIGGAKGGRTYWQPGNINGDTDDHSDYPKDTLDEKALNCIQWHMAMALCVYDGGQLASIDELAKIITNDGANGINQWPWTWQDTSGYSANTADERLSHQWNYETPVAAQRQDPQGGPLDRAGFIAPPGRFPKGYNKLGIADGVGNMLMWVRDSEKRFAWTSSWEQHPKDWNNTLNPNNSTWKGKPGDGDTEGYYAIGGRCSFK